MKAENFYNEFVAAVTEDKYFGEYKNRKEFTDIINKNVIREIIETAGLTPQNEYFNIDVIGWKDRKDEVKDGAKEVGMRPHLWDMLIAAEHENDAKDWLDEVTKLAHIRCRLKVVIGYSPCDERGKTEREKLALAAECLMKTKAFDPSAEEDFLIILGNSAPKNKSNASYKAFDYRGYLFSYEKKTFSELPRK